MTYNEKHDEANLDGNRDGENHNLSWNCGVEGPTDDPQVQALRWQQIRNFLVTLLFSQGVPMISHGDEIGRTQRGNNNAYRQDNELAWMDWNLTDTQKASFEFTAELVRFRLSQPVLLRRRYFQGRSIRGGEGKDVAWLSADGQEMNDAAWNADFVRSLGMLLSGDAIEQVGERGDPIIGDTLLVLLNAHSEQVPFTLPPLDAEHWWQCVVDTVEPHVNERVLKAGGQYPLQGRSAAVLKVSPPIRERRRRSGAAHVAVTAPVGETPVLMASKR